MGFTACHAGMALALVAQVAALHQPRFCSYAGRDCEPATSWQCEKFQKTAGMTPAACIEACDSCEFCIGVVVHQGQCIFKGCDSGCGVYVEQQQTCDDEEPVTAYDAAGYNLYSKNLDLHFCREYFSEQFLTEEGDLALATHVALDLPKFCSYAERDCEPAKSWQCQQPTEITPAACMDACDSCNYCTGVVVYQSQCIFKGCNSDCGVYMPRRCSGGLPVKAQSALDANLYSKKLGPDFCRVYDQLTTGATQVKWQVRDESSLTSALGVGPAVLAIPGIASLILLGFVVTVLTRRGFENEAAVSGHSSLLEVMDRAQSEGLEE